MPVSYNHQRITTLLFNPSHKQKIYYKFKRTSKFSQLTKSSPLLYIMLIYMTSIMTILTMGLCQLSPKGRVSSLSPSSMIAHQPLGRNQVSCQPLGRYYNQVGFQPLGRYYPQEVTNSNAKRYYGNRDKGVRLMSWNKGGSFLDNAMNPIKQKYD